MEKRLPLIEFDSFFYELSEVVASQLKILDPQIQLLTSLMDPSCLRIVKIDSEMIPEGVASFDDKVNISSKDN